MDISKLQTRGLFAPSPKSPPKRTLILLLTASSAVALLILLLLFPSRRPAPSFSVVIDAGSTGTRIHVFAYRIRHGSAVPVEIDPGSTAEMKVQPGLSSYAADPERAGESLTELVEFGREKVGRERLGETEIRLMATAGLRMVEEGARERILESCRRVLRGSGFRFRDDWVSVISGSDEGIFAWVAANYALGTLGGDPLETTGIMELGGASAQVTFVSSEPLPSEFAHILKVGENTYSLYSNSFLHFGQNVAYHSVQELLNLGGQKSSAESAQGEMFIDPCSPKGYSNGVNSFNNSAGILPSKPEIHRVAHASGNFSECRSAAFTLLQKEKDQCAYQKCYLGSIFVPKLRGKFLATENFFFTSKFFGLGPAPILSDFISAGEQFCGADWLDLKKKYHALDDEDFPRYCFSSAFIVALLHDSLGISMDDNRKANAIILRQQTHLLKPSKLRIFCVELEMVDHLVLHVGPTGMPGATESVQIVVPSGSSIEAVQIPVPSVVVFGDKCNGNNALSEDEEPLIQALECRICQEEDEIENLETPCNCSGSLKYAHRMCVQRWCNEKGDTTCEICHEQYKPDYSAPTRAHPDETIIEISESWAIAGAPLDLNDPRLLAVAAAQHHFLEAEYDEYAATNANGDSFCRSAALILMALLILRHALNFTNGDGDDDASTVFSLFLLRAVGFLLPCYIVAWAVSILQRRRGQEAADLSATEVAFILQSRQGRTFQFTIAPDSPTTPQQEPHQ